MRRMRRFVTFHSLFFSSPLLSLFSVRFFFLFSSLLPCLLFSFLFSLHFFFTPLLLSSLLSSFLSSLLFSSLSSPLLFTSLLSFLGFVLLSRKYSSPSLALQSSWPGCFSGPASQHHSPITPGWVWAWLSRGSAEVGLMVLLLSPLMV